MFEVVGRTLEVQGLTRGLVLDLEQNVTDDLAVASIGGAQLLLTKGCLEASVVRINFAKSL